MSEFKQYKRISIAELRPVTKEDLSNGLPYFISISEADRLNGSPKLGDMIARNQNNHDDQWLVAAKYFEDNFEEVPGKYDERDD